MSVLAAALREAMNASAGDLVMLDRDTGTWTPHPWPQVQARAESIAAVVLDETDFGAVGLVGEPTVDFVAALQGTWLAGRSVSILPGPVRGADRHRWAQATLARFHDIGVGIVFGTAPVPELLHDDNAGVPLFDVAEPARRPRPQALTLTPTEAPAVLQGTAGSTGTPRTAQLPPAAVLSNLRGLLDRVGIDSATDVGCSWLPLYHDMGLTFLLAGALAGVSVWLAPTAAFSASPFRWLQWLHDSGATLTAAPNFAYGVVGKYARRVPDVDLGRVRVAINGGEPIDCSGLQRFCTELAKFGFDPASASPSYGLAEATCAVTMPEPGTGLLVDELATDTGTRRHAVLGQPIPGVELRIGAAGRAVGEIELRGESLMSGYLGEPALGSGTWFPTGDLGYFTDGGLVVCGRAKEIISVAGRNVFPTEVEAAAAGVRGVRDGAVVAVGTGDGGLRPGLVIVAEFRGPDEPGARGELVAKVTSECGVVPADVVFIAPGALPRTSSGKLRRLEVKQNLTAVRP